MQIVKILFINAIQPGYASIRLVAMIAFAMMLTKDGFRQTEQA